MLYLKRVKIQNYLEATNVFPKIFFDDIIEYKKVRSLRYKDKNTDGASHFLSKPYVVLEPRRPEPRNHSFKKSVAGEARIYIR